MYRKSLQDVTVKAQSPAATPAREREQEEEVTPGSPSSRPSASSPSLHQHERLKAKMVGVIVCFSVLACLFFLATCVLAVKVMFPKKTSP